MIELTPSTDQLFSLLPGAAVSSEAQEQMKQGEPSTTRGSPRQVLRENAPSDRPTCLSNAGLLPEGGDATFTGDIVSSDSPAGFSSVAAGTTGEGVSSGSPGSQEKFNADIKSQLRKEIRQFGRSKY